MRQVKFRGRVEHGVTYYATGEIVYEEGQWLYGNLIQSGDECFIVGKVIESDNDMIEMDWWCPVDPKTVGQFTGLKDKNGKEIYEGDLIKYLDKIYEVNYKGGTFGIDVNNQHVEDNGRVIGSTNFEVIGNIHDNPELLEAE